MSWPRLQDLKKDIRAAGGTIEPGKGSHLKVKNKDGRAYPIPAHNGMKSEVPPEYVKGLAKHLGISVDDLPGYAKACREAEKRRKKAKEAAAEKEAATEKEPTAEKVNQQIAPPAQAKDPSPPRPPAPMSDPSPHPAQRASSLDED